LRGEDPAGRFNVELEGDDTIKITVGNKVIKFDDDSNLSTYREKVDEAMKLIQNSEPVKEGKKKRTIAQIIKEDGVNPKTAAEIYNKQ
jgi:hypothetical protein